MTFKPAIWTPIAAVLSLINVVAVGFAAQAAEPLHAATHAALALAFGLWAQRLRQRLRGQDIGGIAQDVGGRELQARLEPLEDEVGQLRQELSEAQERLDFAERLLAQRPEPRRMGPEA